MEKTKTEADPISAPAPSRVAGIQERIKPVSAGIGGPFSALFYGRSGTGKTTLAGTFPKPAVILDISEKGKDSIEDIEGIEVLKVENWEDFESMYWYLRSGKHPYKTVIVDTVTQLQKFATEYVRMQDGKERTAPMNKNLWGLTSSLMSAWLINYRDLPMYCVFLAQDRDTAEEGNAGSDQMLPEIGPRVMPSVAGILNGAVKVIGQTYIKEFVKTTKAGTEKVYSFRLRIGPHPIYLTKVRKPKSIVLPQSIHDPSFDKLVTIMYPPQKVSEEKAPETTVAQNTQTP